jgi:hypothetical protein
VLDPPRRRESQSFTHSGTIAAANAADPSARIHISASACLHGNFLLGHVHLCPASASLTTTRYGVAPEPWHSTQIKPSPAASVGHVDGLSSFSRGRERRLIRSECLDSLKRKRHLCFIAVQSLNSAKHWAVHAERILAEGEICRIGTRDWTFKTAARDFGFRTQIPVSQRTTTSFTTYRGTCF